jgi:AraC-like DNA-binding protein
MIKKKEGFKGQRSIVLPRKIMRQSCRNNPIIEWVYITDIGYYPKAQYHFRQRAHGIDQNILIYCVEGKGTARILEKKYELLPGSFIIIPAGTPHSYAASEEDCWTIYWMHFKGIVSSKIVENMMLKNNSHYGMVEFQSRRLDLFEDIYTSLERGYGNDNLCYASMCLYHYLSSFLYASKFNLSEKIQVNDAIEESISYMQRNISKLLSLEEIAGSVNFSVSHYCAIFRKKTGFAPIEYFNHLKVQRACQFLHFTDLRIKEIADKLGIADPYYFSRMFTKLMGLSPNQYRSKKNA